MDGLATILRRQFQGLSGQLTPESVSQLLVEEDRVLMIDLLGFPVARDIWTLQ